MAQHDTNQNEWQVLNQATVDQTAVTTHYLAYGTTWASTSEPHCAQNPAKKPAAARRLPIDANAIRLRFLVADTADDEVTAVIWGWDINGGALDLLTLNPIQAGTSVCSINPVTGAALTNFRYADVITATTDNCNVVIIKGTANGIAEVQFDFIGMAWLFCSYKTDGGSGTAGTDCISIYKYL